MVTAIRDPNDKTNNAWIFTQDDDSETIVILPETVQDEADALAMWPQLWNELNADVEPMPEPVDRLAVLEAEIVKLKADVKALKEKESVR